MLDFSLIFNFLASSSITLISIIFLLPVARKFKLVDTPSVRKSHLGNVPLVGGLSILIGVYTSTSGSLIDDTIFLTYMASAFSILIVGLTDDFHPLTPKMRLIIQTVIILITLDLTGLKFETLGKTFGRSVDID